MQNDDASMAMNPHEAAKKEAEETSEERAKRIASQWINDDSAAPAPTPAPTQVVSIIGSLAQRLSCKEAHDRGCHHFASPAALDPGQ